MSNIIFLETVNTSLCASCGFCCNNLPGLTIPSDWGRDDDEIRTNITAALASGDYCVDRWEGDPRYDDYHTEGYLSSVEMVRPRLRDYKDRLTHYPFWERGACLLLTPTGCSLPLERRPYECRSLMPQPDRKCYQLGMKKQEIAIEWVPFVDMIDSILKTLA